MLDLTKLTANLYQVKLLDGTTLSLKRPTQRLYGQLAKLSEVDSVEGQMVAAMPLFVEVLNNNDQGRTFDLDEVEAEYDFSIALIVIADYLKFYTAEITGEVKNR